MPRLLSKVAVTEFISLSPWEAFLTTLKRKIIFLPCEAIWFDWTIPHNILLNKQANKKTLMLTGIC
jgi:hypothetical protein